MYNVLCINRVLIHILYTYYAHFMCWISVITHKFISYNGCSEEFRYLYEDFKTSVSWFRNNQRPVKSDLCTNWNGSNLNLLAPCLLIPKKHYYTFIDHETYI